MTWSAPAPTILAAAFSLAAHGVERDDAALEKQGVEQFGDRRDLAAFVATLTCPNTIPLEDDRALTMKGMPAPPDARRAQAPPSI